jgi:hypothetical protein
VRRPLASETTSYHQGLVVPDPTIHTVYLTWFESNKISLSVLDTWAQEQTQMASTVGGPAVGGGERL